MALGVHIGAMHTPFFQDLLGIAPLTLREWALVVGVASSILVVMELHKWLWKRRPETPALAT